MQRGELSVNSTCHCLSEWYHHSSRGENTQPSPIAISSELAALRKTHTKLLDVHGELKAELAVTRAQLQQSQLALESEQNTVSKLETDVRLAKEEIRRFRDVAERREREVKVKEREVEFLKSLIVSSLF